MVPKTDYLSETAGSKLPEKLRSHSLLPWANRVRNGRFSSPEEPVPAAIPPVFSPDIRSENCRFDAYSAASASSDFGLPADIMKSLMRGTISERKREPLKTP